MSWDDYVFEDYCESRDRCHEEGSNKSYRGKSSYTPIEECERECIKCQYIFDSDYPQSCPECGGWTKIIEEDDL